MEREPGSRSDLEAVEAKRGFGTPCVRPFGSVRVLFLPALLLTSLIVACPGPADWGDGNGDLPDVEVTGVIRTVPDEVTGTREIEIDLSDIDGATRMRFSERPADIEAVDWQPFDVRLSWLLSGGDGTKVIDAELANDAGGLLRAEARLRLVEHTPRGRFTINGGSLYTDRSEVELNSEEVIGADQMRFASSAEDLAGSSWVTFDSRQAFFIGEEEGLHVVYGQFQDGLGRVLEQSSSITLMLSSPGGSFSIDGGATHTNDPQRMVVLDFTRITNAVELRVANEEEELGDFTEMVLAMEWKLSQDEGPKVVRAEFRSPFGLTNSSSAQIVYDVTPPLQPEITGPQRTGNRRPTWVFDAEGATRYRVRLGAEAGWIETVESSFTPQEPLSACNRDYTLTVAAGDQAGNWSAEASSTVYVYCQVTGSVSLHDPSRGDLFIVLLDEQEYATGEVDPDSNRWAVVPASDARFRFEDIPDGEWIILGFQDNDGNGELTIGFLGAPVEPWGTYQGESGTSLISFAQGHFVIAGDGRSGVVLRLSGFKL